MKATFLQNRCISTLKYYNKRDGEILIIHCYKIRDVGLIPGLGRSPGGRYGNHSYILAWRIQGQRSLVGYSPQDCKELGMTEVT